MAERKPKQDAKSLWKCGGVKKPVIRHLTGRELTRAMNKKQKVWAKYYNEWMGQDWEKVLIVINPINRIITQFRQSLPV